MKSVESLNASSVKTAGVIIIGAEVLSAKLTDLNGPFILKLLREKGIAVKELRIIDDVEETIIDCVSLFSEKFDFVFTTGGIGPTHDDVTMQSVAKAVGENLVYSHELAARMEEKISIYFNPELSEGLSKPEYILQALEKRKRLFLVPENAKVELVGEGFQPAIWAGNICILPGVPHYMQNILNTVTAGWNFGKFISDSLDVYCSESKIAQFLEELQNMSPNISIGSYPQFGENKKENVKWHAKITFDGRDEKGINVVKAKLVNWCKSEKILFDI